MHDAGLGERNSYRDAKSFHRQRAFFGFPEFAGLRCGLREEIAAPEDCGCLREASSCYCWEVSLRVVWCLLSSMNRNKLTRIS